MKYAPRDVEQMVAALMTVLQSTNRARSKGAASRLVTLSAIGASPDRALKEISEELGLHPSSVTRQIQALEADGAVKLTADPEDGRSCRVRLTAAGRAELERLQRLGIERYSLFLAGWDASDVREFTRLLLKFEQSKVAVSQTTKLVGGRWRRLKKPAKPQQKKANP
jgi:DNA-binding MarR family transcriptional regulator